MHIKISNCNLRLRRNYGPLVIYVSCDVVVYVMVAHSLQCLSTTARELKVEAIIILLGQVGYEL